MCSLWFFACSFSFCLVSYLFLAAVPCWVSFALRTTLSIYAYQSSSSASAWASLGVVGSLCATGRVGLVWGVMEEVGWMGSSVGCFRCSHRAEKLWHNHYAFIQAYLCSSSCCLLDLACASMENVGIFGFSRVIMISLRDPLEAGSTILDVGDDRLAQSSVGESG